MPGSTTLLIAAVERSKVPFYVAGGVLVVWALASAALGARRSSFPGKGAGLAAYLTATVALDTHIRDVVDLLERDDLSDVTLVGHSYAGMIVTGVAEHARDRIARVVYVDALVPDHGQSAMDILPEPTRNTFRRLAEEGGGWRMRSSDPRRRNG